MQDWLLTLLKAVLAPQDVCAGVDEPVPWEGDHSPAQTCQRKVRVCRESTGLERPSGFGIPVITSLLIGIYFLKKKLNPKSPSHKCPSVDFYPSSDFFKFLPLQS